MVATFYLKKKQKKPFCSTILAVSGSKGIPRAGFGVHKTKLPCKVLEIYFNQSYFLSVPGT